MMNTDVYSQIVRLAEKSGMSVRALCLKAGVSPGTVTRWRSGKNQPSFRIWQKLEGAANGDAQKG